MSFMHALSLCCSPSNVMHIRLISHFINLKLIHTFTIDVRRPPEQGLWSEIFIGTPTRQYKG